MLWPVHHINHSKRIIEMFTSNYTYVGDHVIVNLHAVNTPAVLKQISVSCDNRDNSLSEFETVDQVLNLNISMLDTLRT